MPTVEHNALTSPELHEPKGVASATENTLYVADGDGSGAWQGVYLHGWEDVADTGSSQSLSTSYVDLTNDGAGSTSVTTYRLPSGGAVWDTANNQFDFATAGLEVGDTVFIRMDFDLTTAAANSVITTAIDFAHGHASEFELVYDVRLYKTAATRNHIVSAHFYIGSTDVLNNPAKIKMKSDNASDTVAVNGWFVNLMPRRPRFA